jgi:hypothetical protein
MELKFWVEASSGWGLKEGKQSVKSIGCHGSPPYPLRSAFPALPSLRRAGTGPLVSQHLPDARRATTAMAMWRVRQVLIGAAGHGLLQPQDPGSGGLPLAGCHAAGRHPCARAFTFAVMAVDGARESFTQRQRAFLSPRALEQNSWLVRNRDCPHSYRCCVKNYSIAVITVWSASLSHLGIHLWVHEGIG